MASKSRGRKSGSSRGSSRKPKTASPTVLETQPEAPSAEAHAELSGATAAFGDALAGAFLYAPEWDRDADVSASAVAAEAVAAEAVAAEPVPAEVVANDDLPQATVESGAATPTTDSASVDDGDDTPVELPFIIDIPREVPVEAESESVTGAVVAPDEPAGATLPADEWVDQVFEPTKSSTRQSRRRSAPNSLTPVSGRTIAKPPAKAVNKAVTKPVTKPVAKPVTKPVAKPTTRASGPDTVVGAAPNAAAETGSQTRWWLVAPVFLVAAVVLFLNRPGQRHAPVPAGVLGTWTTSFWLYERQTLEIKADTVVATLDEPEEGRFPITKVETNDAGREVAVKITYQHPDGEEKVLDFLADKDPTTALRFRAHTGLVWVKPD